jgi:hypothetical protein
VKSCKACGQTKPDEEFYGRRNQCKPCYNAATVERKRVWRASHPDRVRAHNRAQYRRDPAKYLARNDAVPPAVWNARQAVYNAVRDGRLVRPPTCACCGVESDRIEGHHADYSKPLEVVWLCKPCHTAAHMVFQEVLRDAR